jgi:hypothetical protein
LKIVRSAVEFKPSLLGCRTSARNRQAEKS